MEKIELNENSEKDDKSLKLETKSKKDSIHELASNDVKKDKTKDDSYGFKNSNTEKKQNGGKYKNNNIQKISERTLHTLSHSNHTISQSANIIINNNINTNCIGNQSQKEKKNSMKETTGLWTSSFGKAKKHMEPNEREKRDSLVRNQSITGSQRTSEDPRGNEFVQPKMQRFSSISSTERCQEIEIDDVVASKSQLHKIERKQCGKIPNFEINRSHRRSFDGLSKSGMIVNPEKIKKSANLKNYNNLNMNRTTCSSIQNTSNGNNFMKQKSETSNDFRSVVFQFNSKKLEFEKQKQLK